MSEISNQTIAQATSGDDRTKASWLAAGGVFGAIAASSCCILPLVLFSLGITGAWIGKLTALSTYQPIFIALTVASLGYGYWLVYRNSRAACSAGEVCARPLRTGIVKGALWLATLLVGLAIAWPYIIPLMLG